MSWFNQIDVSARHIDTSIHDLGEHYSDNENPLFLCALRNRLIDRKYTATLIELKPNVKYIYVRQCIETNIV